jgi:hypothetical protein
LLAIAFPPPGERAFAGQNIYASFEWSIYQLEPVTLNSAEGERTALSPLYLREIRLTAKMSQETLDQ